jgi:hypothetical protein
MVLALEHEFYPALVFDPAPFCVDADFPAIRVDAHGAV